MPTMPAMQLPDAQTLADLCRVSVRQARRWRADPTLIPYTALVTVALLHYGDLSVISPAWAGWEIDGRQIRNTAGSATATPDQLQALPWLNQTVKQWGRERAAQRDNPLQLTTSQQRVAGEAQTAIDGLQAELSRVRGVLASLTLPEAPADQPASPIPCEYPGRARAG